MSPHYQDDWLTIHQGDCREVMALMEQESVHCVITSPPYWGLRDYGTPGQLGLEPTPEAYVANMVAVFREVRRVLRDDGTLWLNLGDSYIADARKGRAHMGKGKNSGYSAWANRVPHAHVWEGDDRPFCQKCQFFQDEVSGLKSKDLAGIPWRVAFALQADGWYLRSDIIWSKPNPMPESVTDRPTKSHEYLFLLSKSPRYYFDADAVREPNDPANVAHHDRYSSRPVVGRGPNPDRKDGGGTVQGGVGYNPAGRNIRSVWTVATQPYPGAHFATFPEKLIEPPIKAGCPDKVCAECGRPWRRITETTYVKSPVHGAGSVVGRHYETGQNNFDGAGMPRLNKEVRTMGWIRSCAHEGEPVPGTVLDPFGGSGTVARVANRLSRRAVLIDLNADYIVQQLDRNRSLPLGLETA